MNAMTTAKMTLGVFAAGMTFFSVAPKPADSLIPVSVDLDATATAIAATQATQRSTIAAAQHIDMGIAYAKQVLQWQQEIQELKGAASMLGTPNSLSSLTNEIVTLNNQNPTTAGTQLANILVAAQTGSSPIGIGETNLTSLQNEALAAVGNLQGHAANVDASVAETAATIQNTKFEATMEQQDAADLNNARWHYYEMLDISNSTPISNLNGGTGGFSTVGIRNYSNGSYF